MCVCACMYVHACMYNVRTYVHACMYVHMLCIGMILDSPLEDKPWTLGEYTRQHGGSQNRSKRVWGIVIPYDIDEAVDTSDSVRSCYS